MRLRDIEKKALKLGLKLKKASKKDLIVAIQKYEGNFPCFGTAKNNCDQFQCLWREDCLNTNL